MEPKPDTTHGAEQKLIEKPKQQQEQKSKLKRKKEKKG